MMLRPTWAVTAIILFLLAALFIPSNGVRAHAQSRTAGANDTGGAFWPNQSKFALSFSFDDADPSQIDLAVPLLEKYRVKATFYIIPMRAKARLDEWKTVARSGHEIGNHTVTHPCSANHQLPGPALEDMDLQAIKKQISTASAFIQTQLGVEAETFAYPCGLSYVGRGIHTQSYVPTVARAFVAARTTSNSFRGNDLFYLNMDQLAGIVIDHQTFDTLLPVLEAAKHNGSWVILVSHAIGSGDLATSPETLEKLLQYASDPANAAWVAPVDTIAKFIKAH